MRPEVALWSAAVKTWPIAIGVAVALAFLCTGCSDDAAPLSESRDIQRIEVLVADYAQTHHSEVGPRAGCAARVVGQTVYRDSSREVYFELMCSSLEGKPSCPDTDSSAFVTAAVATISATGTVSALGVDDENDSATYQWVVRHFPARWQHTETGGPKYGQLLRTRLLERYPCPAGVQPLPG